MNERILKFQGIEYQFTIDGQHYNLVIENPKLLSFIHKTLFEYDEEAILYTNKEFSSIDFRKESYVCVHPLMLTNDRKALTALVKNIDNEIPENQKRIFLIEFQELVQKIRTEIRTNVNGIIETKEEFSFLDLLKILEISISEFNSPLESLCNYFRVLAFLYPLHLVFVMNIQSYLESAEISLFLEEMTNLGISVINITFADYTEESINWKHVIMDADLCEFYRDSHQI